MGKRGKYGQGRVYQPTYKAEDGTVKTVSKWYIQYYNQEGKQVRESTDAKTEKEARGILAVKLGQVHQGTAPRVEEKTLRYGDIREDLLRYFRVNKMASLEVLADGTESAKGLTKLDEYFGFDANTGEKGMKVVAFSSRDWDDNFITKRRREGVSDATISNSAKLLDQMFKQAVKNGRLTVAPKITIPTPPKAREVYLSKEQFDVLMDKGMDKKFHPLLTFMFYQGVRIGETLSITWDQLDLGNGVFLPDPDKNKTGNKDPKPLQNETVRALKTIKRDSEFAFEDVRSDGGNPAKRFEKAFRAAMLRLGFGKPMWQCSQCRAVKNTAAPGENSTAIECNTCKGVPMQYHYVGPTPHCLRASTVVFYRESGMSDAEIMAITGHESSKSFMGYSRTRVENVKARMDIAETSRRKMQKLLVVA